MNKTILVIDNDESIRMVLDLALAGEAGYTVCLASRGQDALDFLRLGEVQPDLILVEQDLPRMSGEMFIRQLSSEGRRTMPVILMSVMEEILWRGSLADGYLIKPFGLEELFETVEQLQQGAAQKEEVAVG
jgi:DNA-binding response OmpR family regulator